MNEFYHQIDFKLFEEAGWGMCIKNVYTLFTPGHPLEALQSITLLTNKRIHCKYLKNTYLFVSNFK